MGIPYKVLISIDVIPAFGGGVLGGPTGISLFLPFFYTRYTFPLLIRRYDRRRPAAGVRIYMLEYILPNISFLIDTSFYTYTPLPLYITSNPSPPSAAPSAAGCSAGPPPPFWLIYVSPFFL